MAKGSLVHACLEAHYNGKPWTDVISAYELDLDKVFDEERDEFINIQADVVKIMRAYTRTYSKADSLLKTLATEVHFEFELGDHTYQGYIDWIVADANNDVWVVDHKTCKQLPSESELFMDLQTLIYHHAMQVCPELQKIAEGRRIAGIIFNHIRTKAPREPELLKAGGLSKKAIDTDVATYVASIKKNGLDLNDYTDMIEKLKDNHFFRRTKIPATKRAIEILLHEIETILDAIEQATVLGTGDDCPRTMLKMRCSWDCEFFPLCIGELSGRNVQGIIDAQYEEKLSEEDEADGGEE